MSKDGFGPKDDQPWQIEVVHSKDGTYWETHEDRETAERMAVTNLSTDPDWIGRTTGRIRPLLPGEPTDARTGGQGQPPEAA